MAVDTEQALEALLALTNRLNRDAPLDAGAAEVCGRLALLGAARGVALFATEQRGQGLVLLGAYALPALYVQRYPVGQAVELAHVSGDLRDAATRGEPVNVLDLEEDKRTLSLAGVAREGRLGSAMAIPLVYERRTVGVIHAFYGRHPRVDLQQRLVRASPLLSSTLARESMRLAGGDLGTRSERLYPREQVERQLKHVHAAAERYGHPYAVVVYGVDRPDILARRYGPELVRYATEQLLEFVAAECRDADQPGLYEEAMCQVVMPGTRGRGAFSQVERVAERFGRHAFRAGEHRLQLTASAGISTFPESGALTGKDSVRSAHAALDEALGDGGQGVVVIAAAGAAAPSG